MLQTECVSLLRCMFSRQFSIMFNFLLLIFTSSILLSFLLFSHFFSLLSFLLFAHFFSLLSFLLFSHFFSPLLFSCHLHPNLPFILIHLHNVFHLVPHFPCAPSPLVYYFTKFISLLSSSNLSPSSTSFQVIIPLNTYFPNHLISLMLLPYSCITFQLECFYAQL